MDRIVLHRLGRHYGHHDLEPTCGVMDIYDGPNHKYRVVVDAGSVIRRKKGREWLSGPDLRLLHDGKLIDSVLITHAHYDHMGYLPAIVPYMKAGAKIFMTRPTSMAIRYAYLFELSPNPLPSLEKPWGPSQVIDAMHRFEIIGRVGRHEILPRLDVWVNPAGHIAGACNFTFDINGRKVHYTGDRCDHNQPSVLGAPALPDNWRPDIVAQSDCTYGKTGSDATTWLSEMDRMTEFCEQALHDRRKVLIYTFAMHRAGAIAHELQRRGVVRSQNNVHIDGSAKDYARMMNGKHAWCEQDSGFDVSKIGMLEAKFSRHGVHDGKYSSYIVIAPAGMGGPGGSGTWWRRRLLMDPTAAICFTGYAAPDTDGAKILEAAKRRADGKKVRHLQFQELNRYGAWRTKTYPFHCQVEHFRLGSHNNHTDTVQWFCENKPKVAILSHGSHGALKTVGYKLRNSGIQLIRADENPSVEINLRNCEVKTIGTDQ